MSRSNPIDLIANPATRWFEWNGDAGNVKFYNKATTETEQVQLPFEFVLLDRLSVIKGWHMDSESGITSNEVRDTRNETLLVKAFKMAEPIAEGFYADIKDKVKAKGGSYAINLYIAYTGDDGQLALGAFTLRGAARGAWIDFESTKENRPHLYKKGIVIKATAHGEKGTGKRKIEWEAPVFEFAELPQSLNDEATNLDLELLQPYLKNYFSRAKQDQTENEYIPKRNDESNTGKDEYDQTPAPENLDQSREYDDEIPF